MRKQSFVVAAAAFAAVVLFSESAKAATITVTTSLDTLGACSLRAAILSANTKTSVGGCQAGSGEDTIVVPAGMYTLTIEGANEDNGQTGDLDVTSALTISGAGALTTVVDGNRSLLNDRVLEIRPGGRAVVSGVTIQNGGTSSLYGGGVSNRASLALVSSIVRDNRATDGGGIFSAGIMGPGSTVAYITLTNSTLFSNTATGFGGGLSSIDYATIANSTISSNTSQRGGGVSANGPWSIRGSTLYGNLVSVAGSALYALFSGSVQNDILASGGTVAACTFPGPSATSLGHNLGSDNSCNLTGSGDIVNGNIGIAPIANNGGSMLTHALMPGSVTINAGNDAACSAFDQRGFRRPIGGVCDIGAFEYAPGVYLPVVVP